MSIASTTTFRTNASFVSWFYFVYFSKACGQELC